MRKFPGRRINNFRNIYLILRPAPNQKIRWEEEPIRKFAGSSQSENSLGGGGANQKIAWGADSQ